jgi:hypothetical protein
MLSLFYKETLTHVNTWKRVPQTCNVNQMMRFHEIMNGHVAASGHPNQFLISCQQ